MANVEAQHPDYQDWKEEWTMLRHCERGPKAVKNEGKLYLPMPEGFEAQEDGGVQMYLSYTQRAEFSDILNPTLSGMVGLIHKVEPKIDMPARMQPIWEKATMDGLSL